MMALFTTGTRMYLRAILSQMDWFTRAHPKHADWVFHRELCELMARRQLEDISWLIQRSGSNHDIHFQYIAKFSGDSNKCLLNMFLTKLGFSSHLYTHCCCCSNPDKTIPMIYIAQDIKRIRIIASGNKRWSVEEIYSMKVKRKFGI